MAAKFSFCYISASNSPRHVIFALNMGFWARDSIGSIMNAPNSKWPPDFKMAAILTCKDGFYYKNNHQLTPAFA